MIIMLQDQNELHAYMRWREMLNVMVCSSEHCSAFEFHADTHFLNVFGITMTQWLLTRVTSLTVPSMPVTPTIQDDDDIWSDDDADLTSTTCESDIDSENDIDSD